MHTLWGTLLQQEVLPCPYGDQVPEVCILMAEVTERAGTDGNEETGQHSLRLPKQRALQEEGFQAELLRIWWS